MDPNAFGDNSRAAPRGAWSAWRGYLAVLVVFFGLYAATAQRGCAWQDSGIYQWRILRFDLTGRLGLALSHPLLILLGRAFSAVPAGPVAWRMNLVSAVFAALAAANVFLLVRRLVPDRPASAWFAAGVFGLAHTTWWLATICESQAVFVALFTAEVNVLLSLVRRPRGHLVLLLGGLNGLALTAHNLALLAAAIHGLVVIGLCLRRRLRWHAVGLLGVGWAVGAAGLLVMVAHLAADVGPRQAVESALFGQRWKGDVLGGSLRAVLMGGGYVLYNFPNAALPLAGLGLAALRRRPGKAEARALAGFAGIFLLFAIRYTVVDQFMFFLPFYAMVAALAGVGFGRLAARPDRRWAAGALLTVLLGPMLYAAMPTVAGGLGLRLPGRKDLPFRNHARYWLSPWKGGEDSAGRFASAVLKHCPGDGVVIADGTSLYPLLWTREMAGSRGRCVLLATDQATRENIPFGRPNVFVVSREPGYYPAWFSGVASLAEHGRERILFRVVWRRRQGGSPDP